MERHKQIDRIVATNDGNNYNAELYCKVYWALYDLGYSVKGLLHPQRDMYKISYDPKQETIQQLLHILNTRNTKVLSNVADKLESDIKLSESLEFYDDSYDPLWDTGYDSL